MGRWERKEKREKHTDVDLVSRERRPVKLVLVELDEGPVAGVAVGRGVDGNGLDVDDLADHALLHACPALEDLAVEGVDVDNLGLRLHDQVQVLLTPVGDLLRLSGCGLAHPAKDGLPVPDGAVEVGDGTHHALERVVVGRVAEGDDLLARAARLLVRQARVGMSGGRAGDVGASEEEDALAVGALAEVQGAGALVEGCLQRRDEEAERGREGLAEVGDRVVVGVEREHLGAGRVKDDRLAETDLEAIEAGRVYEEGDGFGDRVSKRCQIFRSRSSMMSSGVGGDLYLEAPHVIRLQRHRCRSLRLSIVDRL